MMRTVCTTDVQQEIICVVFYFSTTACYKGIINIKTSFLKYEGFTRVNKFDWEWLANHKWFFQIGIEVNVVLTQ